MTPKRADDSRVALLVTAGTRDEAERLLEGLAEAGLALRGSVIPTVRSFIPGTCSMEWQHEAMVIATVSAGMVEEAKRYIREHHSFDEQHVLALGLLDEV